MVSQAGLCTWCIYVILLQFFSVGYFCDIHDLCVSWQHFNCPEGLHLSITIQLCSYCNGTVFSCCHYSHEWRKSLHWANSSKCITVLLHWGVYTSTIDQFWYIKIQPNTIDLSTRLCGINPITSVCSYSLEPRIEVYCFRLNINILKLVYCNAENDIDRKTTLYSTWEFHLSL